jgi:hypothetical protein
MGTLTRIRLAPARPRIAELRRRAATTPGRLRLSMAVVVTALVVFGVVAIRAVEVRSSAVASIVTRDEPQMLQAEGLYASLSDADATAATTLLAGGLESSTRRQRYLAALRNASLQLAALGQRSQGAGEAARAIDDVAATLPVYSGLVETARANNRQGFPVGAAYLRRASKLMREQTLPAAGRLYALEARRLADDQATATSGNGLFAVMTVIGLALFALIWVQLFLARRTRRVFNVRLVAATVSVIVIGAWVTVGMIRAANATARAQREGSDSVQLLSAARILALRAQADESLALVARGGGDTYLTDFRNVASALEPPGGLLGAAEAAERRSGTAAPVAALTAQWRGYRAAHERVAALQAQKRFGEAVRLAVGPRAQVPGLADALNRGLATRIAAAQQRFEQSAHAARSAVRGLTVAIVVFLVVAAVLAVFGLKQRVDEYR